MVFHAGGRSVMVSLLPTKTLTIDGDTRLGQSGVPAIFHCDGKGLSQVPQHHHFFKFTRSPQSEQLFLGSIVYVRRFIADILVVTTSPISSPTTTILVFNTFILFYSLWCRFRAWRSFRRTSIIRRMHRRLICFPSNLHVSGFSSCRITSMIHSYLVCVWGKW